MSSEKKEKGLSLRLLSEEAVGDEYGLLLTAMDAPILSKNLVRMLWGIPPSLVSRNHRSLTLDSKCSKLIRGLKPSDLACAAISSN